MPTLSMTAVLAACLLSGPIDPPAGPVTSTLKTLQEVEPRIAIGATTTPGDADSMFRIAQSGSYYLASDVEVFGAKCGIEIDWNSATNVTLDLNGFTVRGQSGTLSGIRTQVYAGGTTLTVRNGTVANMGSWGVEVYAQSIHVESVSVLDCANGIRVEGNAASVARCKAFRNGTGFRLEAATKVSECVADSNTGDGYFTFASSSFDRCTAIQSGGDGFDMGAACVITNCQVSVATGQGIRVGGSSTVRGNHIQAAGSGGDGAGILATSNGNRIEDNHVLSCDRGIDVDSISNTIVRNTAQGNAVNYDINSPSMQWLGPIVSTAAGVGTANAWANFALP